MSLETAEWVLSWGLCPTWCSADCWYEALAVVLAERGPA